MKTRSNSIHHTRLALLVAALGTAGVAQAGVISDVSFFGSIPTTLINFETNGAGTPITLMQAQTQGMPLNAYSNLGVTFTTAINWVNDGTVAFDAAQTINGAGGNSIPSASMDTFSFNFNMPVRAFAFFVASNQGEDTVGPTFVVRDTGGNIIETVSLHSGFVDGTITAGNTVAAYGYMGVFSNVDIGSVTVTKQSAILDDLRISSVPTPGAAAGLGLAMLGAGLRRRRS